MKLDFLDKAFEKLSQNIGLKDDLYFEDVIGSKDIGRIILDRIRIRSKRKLYRRMRSIKYIGKYYTKEGGEFIAKKIDNEVENET